MRQRVFMKCHAEATSLRCRAIFMGGHQFHVSLLPCHLSTSCFVQMSWHGFKWWCAGELCLVLVSFPPRFVFAQLFLIAATHFWGTADTSGSFYLWLVPPPSIPPKKPGWLFATKLLLRQYNLLSHELFCCSNRLAWALWSDVGDFVGTFEFNAAWILSWRESKCLKS